MKLYLTYAGIVAIVALTAWLTTGYWGAGSMVVGICMVCSTVLVGILAQWISEAANSRGPETEDKMIAAARITIGVILFFLPGIVRLLG